MQNLGIILLGTLFLMTACTPEDNLNTYTYTSDQPCISVTQVKGGFLRQDIRIDVWVEDDVAGLVNFSGATLSDKDDMFCACNETATQVILRIEAADESLFAYQFSELSNPCP